MTEVSIVKCNNYEPENARNAVYVPGAAHP